MVRDIEGLDDWTYLLHPPEDSPPVPTGAYVESGQRRISRVKCLTVDAFQKADHSHNGKTCHCGARDKIAADLAALIGVNVPPVLLHFDNGEHTCIQKEPPNQVYETLDIVKRAAAISGDQRPLNLVELAYPAMNVVFDVWLGNCDRRANHRNTLVASATTAITIWLIDFNHALGHRLRPWIDGRFADRNLDPEEVPIPECLHNLTDWNRKLGLSTDNVKSRLQMVHDDLIEEICGRAFSVYTGVRADAERCAIAEGLKYRKDRALEWALELTGK